MMMAGLLKYSDPLLSDVTLGWLIPPLLSHIYFAPLSLGDLKVREVQNNFGVFEPPQGGSDLKNRKIAT